MKVLTIQNAVILASSIRARQVWEFAHCVSWRWWRADSHMTAYSLCVYTTETTHTFVTYDRAEHDSWVKLVDEILGGFV